VNRFFDGLFKVYDEEELVVYAANGVTPLARFDLKETGMASGQSLTPYRDDSHALTVENAELKRTVNSLTNALEKCNHNENEVAKARVAIHASTSLFVYAAAAAIAGGPMLEHPHLLAVVGTLNLFIWTLGSVFRRFGT
jgi:hypothetical protein